MLDERLRDGLADAFIVERYVVVGRRRGHRPVIGDHLDTLALRHMDQRCGGRRIHRVKDNHLGALRDHRVELLLLRRDVGIGVLVEHLAVGAELGHFGLEAGEVMLFVARRRLVGHQKGDRAAGRGKCRRAAYQAKAQAQRAGADQLVRKSGHRMSPYFLRDCGADAAVLGPCLDCG